MALPMTVLRPSAGALSVDLADVMRLLGYKEGITRLERRHILLVEEGIVRTRAAADPSIAIVCTDVVVTEDGVTACLPGLCWQSRSLAKVLRGAVGAALVAITLGPAVEEETRRLFQAEDPASATVVDAAGSAFVHALSTLARLHLAGQLPGYALTSTYGPGYGDWPIEDQPALTLAAGGPAIGLTCSETCYLKPQKSLVGIVGWRQPGAAGGTAGCKACTKADCAYRIFPTAQTPH